MPIPILMPALSPTMTDGNLATWLKKEGDSVRSGDVLAEIETDKATMEVEACDDGILGKILIAAGTEGVNVGTTIALLLEEDEDPEVLQLYNDSSTLEKKESISVERSVYKESASPLASTACDASHHLIERDNLSRRIVASPLAKRIAKNEGIDLIHIKGSGPYGRIVKQDVLNVSSQKVLANDVTPISKELFEGKHEKSEGLYTDVPMSSMRKVISKRLSDAKSSIPHFYLSIRVSIDSLLEMREKINASSYAQTKISVNDFVIKAVACGLQRVPAVCATFHDNFIRQHKSSDISVAVSVEGGLITPIIFSAHDKNLTTISKEMKNLAARAREGSLKPQEYQGGCFSISNLGMFGIEQFQAIINPPQVAILAVGAGIKQMSSSGKEQTLMNLTLSIDHRALDGTDGAAFLNVVKDLLQNPEYLLITP